MKSIPIFAFTLATIALPLAFSQAKPNKPVATPQLSVSERVALQALEKQKQDATQQYQQAAQTELAVVQEYSVTHPGWHLNQQTFSPEQDPVIKPEPAKKK